ncbi:beta-galactosidase [Novosphingobium sp. 1529]|uniref:glycoside hydrolase family 2 TIM barrel-domain containing protein n=1 Tax=Novosphingobium sp. 1529 TaxID=3156424 RepID=UPI003391227E
MLSASRRTILASTAAMAAALARSPIVAQALAAPAAGTPPQPDSPRRRLSLDADWRFHAGDIPFAPLLDHEAAYAHAKAGNATGGAAEDCDDGDWAMVTLPHDFALGQAPDPAANPDQAYRPRGIAWYRRGVLLDPAWREGALDLVFDGIATNATVWINGTLAARHFGGYTPLVIDLLPFARFGDEPNTIAVRVDAQDSEGWWYEGAGLYRHVWIERRAPVHIVRHGLVARPHPLDQGDNAATSGDWAVPLTLDLANAATADAAVTVAARLIAPDGTAVAAAQAALTLPARGQAQAALTLTVPHPRLWSPADPALYRLETRVLADGVLADQESGALGLRTVRFDADRGMLLNGEPCPIKGVCAHQDHAGVGVAVPDSLWDYRLRRIVAMGGNALRTAHHAPAPELLDAADRLGVMILAENRTLSAAPDTLDALAALVRQGRNHASVIAWSLCNEESIQASGIGVAMVTRMKALVRALDPTRPVTAALNGAMEAEPNIADQLDVVGFNYGRGGIDAYHAAHPTRPLLSSEDTSALSTRGAATGDAARHVIADDDMTAVPWGQTNSAAWAFIAQRPWLAGGFLWTGFDYRGEATPFGWPSTSSFFGAMDLCGFAKSGFHIRHALWSATPVIAIWPHWTFPGQEGRAVPILVASNADLVSLHLDGHEIARAPVRDGVARFTPVYAPGRLVAQGWRDGRVVASATCVAAGAPVALRLVPDRLRIRAERRDAVPVTVMAVDAAGQSVPVAQHGFALHVEGGQILGLGNGDPNLALPETPAADGRSGAMALFNGLAQAIVCADGSGPLHLVASAAGLAPARCVLRVDPGIIAALPAVPPAQPLTEWRQAPASAQRPVPGQRLGDGDMNSWAWTKPGATQPTDPAAPWVLLHLAFTPRRAVAAKGGTLRFASVVGRAEIWLDGVRVALKADPAPAPLAIPLPPGSGERLLDVLFDNRAAPGRCGLAGMVSLGA